tara:strand:+ start:43 stop:408 length:366 start_codon:yes stop_codon:yes gene_type:complete
MNIFNCDKVYLDKDTYGGYGVFAKQNIVEGDIVEKGLMMRMVNVDGNENPHLFTWSDDRTIWATGTGLINYYNHSDIPNIKKIGNLNKDTMQIVALRDIKKGEELCNTYMSKNWRTCFLDF